MTVMAQCVRWATQTNVYLRWCANCEAVCRGSSHWKGEVKRKENKNTMLQWFCNENLLFIHAQHAANTHFPPCYTSLPPHRPPPYIPPHPLTTTLTTPIWNQWLPWENPSQPACSAWEKTGKWVVLAVINWKVKSNQIKNHVTSAEASDTWLSFYFSLALCKLNILRKNKQEVSKTDLDKLISNARFWCLIIVGP